MEWRGRLEATWKWPSISLHNISFPITHFSSQQGKDAVNPYLPPRVSALHSSLEYLVTRKRPASLTSEAEHRPPNTGIHSRSWCFLCTPWSGKGNYACAYVFAEGAEERKTKEFWRWGSQGLTCRCCLSWRVCSWDSSPVKWVRNCPILPVVGEKAQR